MEISEMLECVDILEYISQFCDLEERQGGEYWGLSPLKDENTPSFSVDTEQQVFFDFSSGKGGNLLTFICEYHRCSLYRGVQILKEYANIKEECGENTVRRLDATSVAKKFKRKEKRKKESSGVILSDDYMDRYDWNTDKLSAWIDEGISIESLRKFQVRYDPVSDRIVYPIRNIAGEIINICGRTLDPNFKEKRLRKYTYFHLFGCLDTIFGFAENREAILEKREIILFEGAKSVMIADSWGIHNTGALLTSHLNVNQFKLLIQMGVRIVFALDAEVDIRKDVNIMKLRPYATVQWMRDTRGLLDEKDSPVDKGYEVFMTLYNERRSLR